MNGQLRLLQALAARVTLEPNHRKKLTLKGRNYLAASDTLSVGGLPLLPPVAVPCRAAAETGREKRDGSSHSESPTDATSRHLSTASRPTPARIRRFTIQAAEINAPHLRFCADAVNLPTRGCAHCAPRTSLQSRPPECLCPILTANGREQFVLPVLHYSCCWLHSIVIPRAALRFTR